MRTTSVVILMVLMFLTALAAGVVTGRLTARRQPQPIGAVGGSPLSDELQLSREQTDQMRPIWEAVRETARSCAKDAEAIQNEHEEGLKAMLTDEQMSRYQQLSEQDHRRIAALDAKRKEAFRQAVDRTEKILREDQRQAYEQIISNQVGAVPGALWGGSTQRKIDAGSQ